MSSWQKLSLQTHSSIHFNQDCKANKAAHDIWAVYDDDVTTERTDSQD